MHLAVLMTNTDESDFAQRHPKDGEKFTALIQLVRPDWHLSTYSVKDGVFPDDLTRYDGMIITGSPASVLDQTPWTAQLQTLIRNLYQQDIPMFGACYGHQAIALALGGEVGANPAGWVFGLTQSDIVAPAPWMRNLPDRFAQYGAHIEAVTKLPEVASTISVSSDCAVTGYRISNMVYTTQNHPEMTDEFIAALIEEYANKLPKDVATSAKASLTQSVDRAPYAETIAVFFEQHSTHRRD